MKNSEKLAKFIQNDNVVRFEKLVEDALNEGFIIPIQPTVYVSTSSYKYNLLMIKSKDDNTVSKKF